MSTNNVITAAVSATAGLFAGGLAYQGLEANKAKKEAEAAAAVQAKKAEDLQKQLIDEQKNMQDELTKTSTDVALRKKAVKRASGGAGGRSGTILTSPLGEIGQADTAQKTLLGS